MQDKEQKISPIKQRILQYADSLGISKREFYTKIGVSRGTLESRTGITEDVVTKFIAAYPDVSLEWLVKGKGDVTGHGMIISSEEEYQEALDKGLKLLPEVDFKFAGGTTELVGNTDAIKRYWYLPDCKDCEAIAQVAGNSMAPAYPSGCWVALKRYSFDPCKPNRIPFGNVFGIVEEDLMTGEYHGHIKILRRYKDPEMAKHCWIARSIDTVNHDDFDIEISSVRALWIVKQHVVADVLL